MRKRFVCIAAIWYLHHIQSTGWSQGLTSTPHTFLNAKPSHQPSVPPQGGRARSQHPALPKAPVTLLKPPQAGAALRLHSNTSRIQFSSRELGNTRRAWKTSSCVIRHSSSGMRAHNSTRVSSTAFKGTHALKFPADPGILFALPSQPRPEALKAFQANPGVPPGLAALVCPCAVLCGCSWESDGGIFAIH